MPSFDGPNLTITLDSGVTDIDVIDIYSRWKDWVKLGTNSGFPAAFRVIGGDPLGGGIFAGSYFFLQNQDGWRIKPPEEDIQQQLNGNLYPEDALTTFLLGTTGSFNTAIRLSTSSLTQLAEGSGGGGGTCDLTALPDGELKDALTIINTGVQRGSLLIPHTQELDGAYTGPNDDYVLESETIDPNSDLIWEAGTF